MWRRRPASNALEHSAQLRSLAIQHHHETTAVFEQYYRDLKASRFTNAFSYGRHKINVLLECELKRLEPGAKILDVGCGTGEYLARFQALGLDAVGLEPAAAMIEAARRRDPGLRISQGIATELPFGDHSFDFVTAIEVLRYLHRADIRLALGEMLRVLRPGGTLFVTMVNRFALDGFFLWQRARQGIMGGGPSSKYPHCEFYTPGELGAELRAVGATDVRLIGRLFAPMRVAYKVHAGVARRLARAFEAYDDELCSLAGMDRVAGHLIGIATKPRVASS